MCSIFFHNIKSAHKSKNYMLHNSLSISNAKSDSDGNIKNCKMKSV